MTLIGLKTANQHYSKTKKFSKYKRQIQKLFELSHPPITCESKFYLAGFLEGEGSLNVGAKKNNSSKFKVYLDPEFSIAQHINGISNLYLAMCVFQTGRITLKSGSLATFVYTIDNRQTLEEKIIPFYEHYVYKYGCQIKKHRVMLYKQLLVLFKKKHHLNFETMLYKVLPLWDALRMQTGQSNQTFASLKEAQNYVKNAINTKS